MNTRRKGQRNELKSKELLEREGWLVEKVKGSTKWNKNVDFFGLFDIIAIKKVNQLTRILFVQVRSNYISKYHREKIEEWSKKYSDDAISKVQIHVWKDREGLQRIEVKN